jgi:hypothetical protein
LTRHLALFELLSVYQAVVVEPVVVVDPLLLNWLLVVLIAVLDGQP